MKNQDDGKYLWLLLLPLLSSSLLLLNRETITKIEWWLFGMIHSEKRREKLERTVKYWEQRENRGEMDLSLEVMADGEPEP